MFQRRPVQRKRLHGYFVSRDVVILVGEWGESSAPIPSATDKRVARVHLRQRILVDAAHFQRWGFVRLSIIRLRRSTASKQQRHAAGQPQLGRTQQISIDSCLRCLLAIYLYVPPAPECIAGSVSGVIRGGSSGSTQNLLVDVVSFCRLFKLSARVLLLIHGGCGHCMQSLIRKLRFFDLLQICDFDHKSEWRISITAVSRSTQPCIPPESLNRVGVRARMSSLPGGRYLTWYT